jgi:hypothetical protein
MGVADWVSSRAWRAFSPYAAANDDVTASTGINHFALLVLFNRTPVCRFNPNPGGETMKYVPSLPSVVTGATDSLDVYPLSGVKPAKPVQERTLPPLVVHRQMQFDATTSEVAKRQEKRSDPLLQGERRTYCRRIEHPSLLAELRSRMERRRHKQRMGDPTEHVDEEV